MKQELIKKIKQKKEFSGVTNSVINDFLNSYLKKYNISSKNLSKFQQKIIIKEIRAQLRTITGQFQKSKKNRTKLLKKNSYKQLLKTHSSTAERLDFYPKLKSLLKKLKINSILDIGCGLNPIALASPKIKYFASDIREDELSIIKKFFEKNNINGQTFIYDITNPTISLPKADICFIFKVLDIVDKKHKLTKRILNSIPCKRLLVSFPTKKLSGKPMNFPRRIWFEKTLAQLNAIYQTIKIKNEIFYLVDLRQKQSRPS